MNAAGGGSGGRPDRVGMGLFWFYVLLYFGFIAVVVFRPDLLAARPVGGVNLAIAWGLGLIAAALLLAAVSTVACRRSDPPGGDAPSSRGPVGPAAASDFRRVPEAPHAP